MKSYETKDISDNDKEPSLDISENLEQIGKGIIVGRKEAWEEYNQPEPDFSDRVIKP